MDNINCTPTRCQNDHTVAPLFHRAESHNTADPVKLSPSKESLQLSSEYTGNGHETPQETTYSQLSDYSHLAQSGHSSQQLLKAGDQQETVFASTRFYDDIARPNNNDQYGPRVNDITKPQQSPYQWNVIGKVSHTAILVLMLLLLVSIFVMLLYLVTKDSCASGTSNTVSGAGFAGNGGFGSNLSLLQNKIDHLLDHIAQHDENTAIILRKIITSTTESDSTVDDILLAANQLLALTLDLESCHDINHILPNSPSGYYHLNTDQSIYCNMGELCGEKGGWTRLGYLNMSDPTQDCPSDFENTQNEGIGIRACRRRIPETGCTSVNLTADDIAYTQICGRVIGYQKGNTDALRNSNNMDGIDSYYLDGVSITRGSAPREHVWSFIAGQRSIANSRSNCPCNTEATVSVPEFVGDHYYCESGNNSTQNDKTTFYPDPLWDGKDCLSLESPCCESEALPWFHRNYNTLSDSDLELRVCRRGSRYNEDILIKMYEIYVK
uniref:Uncharacterized protein n=1 Tax=Amphimedon queenslandica TaxID=400682 RepID=A0A1X7T870_AMPQE